MTRSDRDNMAKAADTALMAQNAIEMLYLGAGPDQIGKKELDALLDWLGAYRTDKDYRELDNLPF
jgi:hypothetical protein